MMSDVVVFFIEINLFLCTKSSKKIANRSPIPPFFLIFVARNYKTYDKAD
jgi:hypothetical protein